MNKELDSVLIDMKVIKKQVFSEGLPNVFFIYLFLIVIILITLT